LDIFVWEILGWEYIRAATLIVLKTIRTRKDSVVLVPPSTKVTLCSKVKTPKIAPA